MHTTIRTLVVAAAVATVALGPTSARPATAYPDAPQVAAIDGTCEGELLRLHNEARAAIGVAKLREDAAFDQVARSWALKMARSGDLAHNPTYSQQVRAAVPSWETMGENVGTARTPGGVHQAYMDSPSHRATLLSARFERVGLGCARSADGRIWTAVDFVGATATIPDRRPAPFRSAGDASSRLRWWLLAEGPDATQVDGDAANVLGRGWGADDLAVHLAGSSGHDAVVPGVVRLYSASFGREPDAGGLAYWVGRRQADGELDRIASSFVASPEFRTLYGSLADADFVARVYQNVLGRTADARGLAYWVGQLASGMTRGQLMIGFSESPENRAATASDVTVSWAFLQLVDRRPTADERTRWTARLDAGGTQAELVRFLVGSNAFASRVAAGGY